DYVKRPQNAWLIFRNRKLTELRAAHRSKKARQAELSKVIALAWKMLSAEEKQEWFDLAKKAKEDHADQHPGYVYRPKRKTSASGSARGHHRAHRRILPVPVESVSRLT
ncbi:HMG-box, partial [Trametes cingulata]